MKMVHAFIEGRVQGVFYRASTMEEAQRLGLAGWVRNLPDGRVELVAQGPEDRIDELLKWCRKGPPGARVDRIQVIEEPEPGEFNGFYVKY